MNKFEIVEFVNKNEIEVVPLKWIDRTKRTMFLASMEDHPKTLDGSQDMLLQAFGS